MNTQFKIGKGRVEYVCGSDDGVTWARAVNGSTREWDGGAKVRRGAWAYGYHVIEVDRG